MLDRNGRLMKFCIRLVDWVGSFQRFTLMILMVVPDIWRNPSEKSCLELVLECSPACQMRFSTLCYVISYLNLFHRTLSPHVLPV